MRRRHLEYTRSAERLPRRRAPSGCPKQIARAGARNPGSCPSRSSQCRCFSSTVEGSLRSEPRPPALLPAVSKESSGAKGATCNFSRCLAEHLIAILLCSLAKNSPFHHDITVSHEVISSVAEFLVVESIDIVRKWAPTRVKKRRWPGTTEFGPLALFLPFPFPYYSRRATFSQSNNGRYAERLQEEGPCRWR